MVQKLGGHVLFFQKGTHDSMNLLPTWWVGKILHTTTRKTRQNIDSTSWYLHTCLERPLAKGIARAITVAGVVSRKVSGTG
jgi:hypothetical protein